MLPGIWITVLLSCSSVSKLPDGSRTISSNSVRISPPGLMMFCASRICLSCSGERPRSDRRALLYSTKMRSSWAPWISTFATSSISSSSSRTSSAISFSSR